MFTKGQQITLFKKPPFCKEGINDNNGVYWNVDMLRLEPGEVLTVDKMMDANKVIIISHKKVGGCYFPISSFREYYTEENVKRQIEALVIQAEQIFGDIEELKSLIKK